MAMTKAAGSQNRPPPWPAASAVSGPFGQMKAEQKTEASSAFALGRIGEPTDTAGGRGDWLVDELVHHCENVTLEP